MLKKRSTALHAKNSSHSATAPPARKLWMISAKISLITLIICGLSACSFTSTRSTKSGMKRSGQSYVISGKRYYILSSAEGFKEKGHASWYGEPFHGRKTANGEIYDMNKLSAAHKTLPLGTWVEVKNLDNNKTLAVRINDRGPFIEGRIIDLSRAAANEIGMFSAGLARVSIKSITGERARQLAANETKVNARAAKKYGAGRTPAKQTPAAPAAGGGSGGRNKYGVLVTVTPDPSKAQTLLRNLKREFAKVALDTKYQNGSPQFSVCIEGLNQNGAERLKQTLSSRGYTHPQVVAR